MNAAKAKNPKPLPQRFAGIPAIESGRKYLVMGQYCYGAGETLALAVARCRSASSNFKPASSRCLVYDVDAESGVTTDGCITTPAGKRRPVELAKL